MGKNNKFLKEVKEGTKVESYSIKKFKVGAASVVVGASIFLGAGAVVQASEEVSNNTTTNNTTNAGEKVENAPKAVATKVGVEAPKEEAKLDKSGLEKYVKEVSANLEAGKYANKTDESVATLKADLESAKATLENAKTQDELKAAYNKLVTTVNSKLKNKPVEKKETPAVDTTNGKETVGKKAENTEPSAANSHDTNAKAEEGTGFRRNDSGAPQVTKTVNYNDASYVNRNGVTSADTTLSGTGTNGKTVVVTVATPGGATKTYETVVTNGKWTVNLEAPLKSGSDPYNKGADETKITVQYKGENNKLNDETRVYLGRPKFVNDTVVAGQKEVLVKVPKDAVNLWVGFTGSWDRQVIMNGGNPQSQETSTLTAAMADTQDDPIFYTVKLTFLQNVIKEGANGINLQAQSGYSAAGGAQPGTTEVAEAKRLTLTATNEAPTIAATNNGSDVVVKKGEAFDIATLATVADKEDDAQLTVGEPVKARLVSVNGTAVTTFSTATPGEYTLVLKAVDSQGKDSANTITRKVIVTDNQKPVGNIPYSNVAEKEIYVYKGEETNIELSATDDSGKIKDIRIAEGSRGINAPGAAGGKIKNEYGLTFSNQTNANGIEATEDNPAKVSITGTVSVAGKPTYTGKLMTRYLIAEDLDGETFSEPAGNKDTVTPLPEGYFKLVVREQTQKYDVQGQTDPANKIVVDDIDNLSEADFEKIKNNIKIQYNTADDARLADKNGTLVENASNYIKSITKDGDKIVVTYKDGSTDKITLNEVLKINKQPAIDAVDKAAKDKIAEINKTPNATDEEKAAAIAKVNADKEKALNAINDANVTTKAALDQAKDSGTTAIAADNPVVAKKDAAKADVEAARKAKADAINADKNLSQAEKDAAIAKINKAAEDATKAIDAATTDAAVDTAKNAGTTEFGKVNPIAKENAKEAIANALTAKNKEIDARTDLTQAEKDAAKAEAKKLADAELAKVEVQPDNAETADAAAAAQKLVNDAEDKGVTDVTSVHPIAKEQAKKAVADELTKKEAEIDARTDLTQEEKDAAKKEAQDKAKAATDAINAQPSIADSEDKATAAQQAVDTAKNTGVSEVKAVNPEAAKKPAAKKAIDVALKAKEEAIDARTDLSDKEKAAAKLAAKNIADVAKKAIDNATTDAEVETAQTTGTNSIATVNPIAKEAAKKEVADELAKKEAEIDARGDLTQEEKDAAKKETQAKAKEATDAINAQPDTVDTPEEATAAQQAVDAAKDKGVADVKAVNPEAKAKPAAKKAIDDKLAEQLKAIENTPDATDEEKKVASDAARAIAEQAKKAIDAAKSDADVKALEDEAKAEIEKSLPLVEDKPNARKAVDEEAKAKKAEIDARNDLSPKAKETLKAKVDKVANKAKAAIDAVTSVEDVNVIEEADKEAIKAIGDINRPIDKVLVKDPSALTDEEKAKILEEVKKVNPTAKEVKYNENGKIEVTTENGDKGTINPAKLVKTEEDLDNGKGGNDINKPLDKVIVKDPANLTDEEKAKIVAEVEEVNPDAIVTIDENGIVSVSTPDGKTLAIPASDLVRTKEDTEKAGAGNSNILKPADKIVGEANDPDDQAKAEEKLRELNPDTKSVKFDENGDATVTLKDGTTATIPSEDLFRSEADAAKPKAGNDIVKPADKTAVANKDALTPEEKKAIEDKVKAVNPDATVAVDDKGNATVTTPEGKTAVIPGKDLVKSPEDATKPKAGNDIVKPADKTAVANPEKLTDAEKKAIEDKVKAVNPDATVVVDDKGNATVTTPEGKTAVIPATDLVKTPEDAAKPKAGNDIVKPADKTVAANPEQLTDAEKKAIEDKVKAVNPDATVVVDDKGNATVTTPEGITAVIPATDLVKTPEDAAKPKAGNDIVKPADKTLVKDPAKLTDEEKAVIAVKVKEVNPEATVVIDDKGNVTVTTPEGKTAVIPAIDLVKTPEDAAKPNSGNDIVKPADKTAVANKDALTPEEKKAIEDKVKAVNPGATVVVDDKGNATVTTPEGKTAVIPATDLVKTPEDATKPKAGNDIVKPADKTLVKDPNALTDEEKAAIVAKVEAVNPGATVVVDDKGNATVTTPEGKTAVIPGTDLVKTPEDVAKPKAGNDIVKPADKTVVKDPARLTDEEKAAIAAKVKAVNPGATVVVDDKGNATVTTAEGKTAVIPATDLVKTEKDATKPNAGNDVVKPADKTAVANKDALTLEEKKAIEDKVKAVNPGATVVVDDKGNATVTTPEGKTAVIPTTDLVKSPEDATKPKAGNDIVKPADKTVVANPEKLTDAEKKAIEDKVKAVNPDATVVVDDKGNATVTIPEGKTAVIPGKDLVKTEADAAKPNAGNDIVKPADKTLVKDPSALTDEEKETIAAKVKEVNPGATVVVDNKGNATVTTPEGKTAVIPGTDIVKTPEDVAKPKAGNDIVKPADKTLVKDSAKLTDEEKAAIAAKVKAVNPGATVVVDDKGNATVTTPEGKTAVIPGKDLVKTEADLGKENAGNDINTPTARTAVANKDALTEAEKEAVKKAVEAVNSGVTVVVDDKGNATVTAKDGKVAVIPASKLVIPADKVTDTAVQSGINTPATRTLVANKDSLTPEEIAKIKAAVEAVNPGAIVIVDAKGNATVTTKDGVTATISAEKLVKDAKDMAAKNNGENINLDFEKQTVADLDNLTDADKAGAKDKILAANPNVVEIIFDAKGNATVILKDGKTYTILAKDIFKKAEKQEPSRTTSPEINFPEKVQVGDLTNLTDEEKETVKQALIKANPELKEAKITISATGETTIVYPDGRVVVISAEKLVEAKGSNAQSNNDNGGNKEDNSTNVSRENNGASNNTSNSKLGQRLANTGTTETNIGLAGLGLAILGGLLAAARRKNDKN